MCYIFLSLERGLTNSICFFEKSVTILQSFFINFQLPYFLRKMISRRKKTLITALLLCTISYGAVQLMHYQEDYSPLQVLSSAESEAQRLLKFLTSYHYQCNSTLHGTNISDWALCIEQDIGINPEPSVSKTAYSIGPLPDFSFETLLSRNLSVHQLIFLHEPATMAPPALLQLNATVYHTIIMPNDPADFGRNSYDMQTVNSIMSRLGHHHVDILKLESLQDMAHSYEVLYFMVKDGILARFHQLHIMIEIDKIDESYLYGWYKTLYSLFHSAGFRLYHTAASSPLCLQVTMMESCHYFMSWVQNPGPRTFVLYPPAIDGSEEFEIQRLEDLLEQGEQPSEDVIPVTLSSTTVLRLSRQMLMTRSDNCHILVFKYQLGMTMPEEVSALHIHCSVIVLSPLKTRHNMFDFTIFSVSRSAANDNGNMTLSEVISHFLINQLQTNIVFVDLGHSSWTFLTPFLDSGALQKVDQFVLVAPVFLLPHYSRHQPALVLRHQYSELQRIIAFHMVLNEATTISPKSMKFRSTGDLWQMSFVKKTRDR